MAKIRHECFWCGEDLGVYDTWGSDDFYTCGKPECDKAARRIYQEDIEDREYRARQDEYSRYGR